METRTKILVVEDERIVGEDIKRSLESLGYSVTQVVSSGQDAMAAIDQTRPDLILMDIVIQGDLTGIETADRIRSSYDIPVVYLTAYADDKTLERAKITEPYGFILKPFDDRELHSIIEMALYKHQIERKLREREAWFSTILRSIGDAVIATDTNGCVTFMNSEAEELTGWNLKEASSQKLKDVYVLLDQKTGKPVPSPVDQILRHAQLIHLPQNVMLRSLDGRIIPIDESMAPIRDDRGDIAGVVLVFKNITQRIQAEEDLRRAEREKEVILSSVSELLMYLDTKLHVVWANRSAGETIGQPASALVGQTCDAIWHQRGMVCEDCPVQRAINDGQTHESEITGEDGRVWFVRGYPVHDDEGQIIGAVEVALEITNWKRAEEALRISEKRYRGLFQTMDQGVLYYNSEREVIDANPAAQAILGMRLSQLRRQSPMDPRLDTIREDGSPFPPEEHPVVISLQNGKSISNVVLGILTPEQKRKWLLVSATPVFLEEKKKPGSVFTTFSDITRMKEMEIILQERNAQLSSLNAIARVVSGSLELNAIMHKALKQVIRFGEFSTGVVFLFDEKRDAPEIEVYKGVSQDILQRLRHLHTDKSSFFRRLLLRGNPQNYAIETILSGQEPDDHGSPAGNDGTSMTCLVVPIKVGYRVVGSMVLFGNTWYSPDDIRYEFFSSIGSHVGLAVTNARLYEETHQTLEKLKETQDKLVQSEKLAGLGAMAGNVVHEIGNPLAAISNSVQVLQARVHLEGKMKELMDIIGWETERLHRSVDQLREFSRPRQLQFERCDLTDVVRKAIIVLNQDFELMWGRTIETRFSKNRPYVLIDADAIEQVVLNLIKNGLQAVKEDGVVTVHVRCRGKGDKQRALLQIVDHGSGISQDHLQHVFEPYFSTKARGMGLGMHIVKQIVESHGGRIQIKSEEGKGTTVSVEIPFERKDDGTDPDCG